MNRFTVTLALVLSLALSGVAGAQGAHLTGTVIDPTGAALPGVTVSVEHVDATERSTIRVTTDRTGRYNFVDLRPGSYTLSASLAGFDTYRAPMNVDTGDDRERTLQLQVGSLQETVVVTTTDTPQPPRPVDVQRPAATEPPAQRPIAAGAIRIGGQIKAPRKIADVHPTYPSDLASQGVEGQVSLTATIGSDGYVKDVQVVSSPNDAFSSAASAAVSQWQFTPTLLNGSAIDVRMRVLVSFKK